MKKNIAVLMGGYSLEYDISIKSGLNVFNSIDKLKFNVFKVIIEKESWYYLDDENQKFEINKKNFSVNDDLKFDLAFIVIHGDPGENGIIQNYFNSISIPYTGCSSEVSKMTFSKKDCIESVRKLNVKTAKSFIINKHNDYDLLQISDELKYPFFVKANNSGSSFGVYKVYDKKELESAVIENFTIDNEIILEEFIDGKEYSVGVARIDGNTKVFGVTELISENDFFDYEAKYNGKSLEITPAKIDKNLEELIHENSKTIYNKLKLNGFSRIDYIVKNDTPFFLEVNTIPGMTDKSIFPKQVKLNNINLKDLFTKMINESLESHNLE